MTFLEKLYDTNISLGLLLIEGKSIAEELNDKLLLDFIDKELNGYPGDLDIPEYRKIPAQIAIDIIDVFGTELYKEKVYDFSPLSENLGFNLETSYHIDSITFLETGIESLTGNMASKPFPKGLVKLLDEAFHSENPQLHITNAYYKISTASLKYILQKVRQELIISFQKPLRNNQKNEFLSGGLQDLKRSKKVFVTYAWEDDSHNSKIVSFVNFLRNSGFDASMDRKQSQEESSLNFNKMMLNGIQNSDKVIIVLSEKYRERANKFEGGVGDEYSLIFEDIKQSSNKYILVSFGKSSREKITPTGFMGREILDLKKDQDENEFNSLFAKIKEENIVQFIDVNIQEIEVVKNNIKPFKL